MKLLSVSDIRPFDSAELARRIRAVELKGIRHPDGSPICVYRDATITVRQLSADEVLSRLYTPQPKVYRERLDFFAELRDALMAAGAADPLDLRDGGYDFVSMVEGDDGEISETLWTMIPPVLEILRYPVTVDYAALGAGTLGGFQFLPEVGERRVEAILPMICDGDHRVWFAVRSGNPVTVLEIDGILPGYPYYALPQRYHKVELATRADGELPENVTHDKIHILVKEDEKKLYRLFPTGGIYSGDVRPDAKPAV